MISASPSGALKYDKQKLTAKAGKVTITMKSPSVLAHNAAIKGLGASKKGKIVSKGGTSTMS